MGLINWLRGIFAPSPSPLKRNVSQLADADEGEDLVEETVDTSGGPLKENHRRRALRDPRLLPKPEPKRPVPYHQREPRKRYMEKEEADRLFAATMRTRNRDVRDLLADEEQLQRLGLPIWKTEEDVASALGITVKLLRHYSIHRQKEKVPHYITFAIPKRSGGQRLIMAPKRRLKAIQRKLNDLLVKKLPVNECAHGFRDGRSVRSNAQQHVNKAIVTRMDLKDFFPTVHYGRVRGLLISYGYSYPVATALSVLMTESVRQPVQVEDQIYYVPVGPRHCVQGAPTSPAICNAILLKLDRRLSGLAKKMGYTYTRYADDLTFSGNDEKLNAKLVHFVRQIVEEEGFQTNGEKTRIAHRGGSQKVTGVTVNHVLGLSRKERRKLRAAIHQARKNGAATGELPQPIEGKLAYLHMLNASQAEALRRAPDAKGESSAIASEPS